MTSRISPRSTAAMNSLKMICGSPRYDLLKTLKIIRPTSATPVQIAIRFDDELRKPSVQETYDIDPSDFSSAGPDAQWKALLPASMLLKKARLISCIRRRSRLGK